MQISVIFMKKTIIFTLLLVFCISCAQIQSLQDDPEQYDSEKQRVMTEKAQDKNLNLPTGSSLLDDNSGFTLSGVLGLDPADLNTKSITFEVALDKISFMPLLSVDSMSGVIVTDWYSLDNGQNRIKINIRVVDQEMSNESVVVSLFSQSLDGDRWIDQGINLEQSLKIKESILSSARSLKIASEL
jgi:hypothetical protein